MPIKVQHKCELLKTLLKAKFLLLHLQPHSRDGFNKSGWQAMLQLAAPNPRSLWCGMRRPLCAAYLACPGSLVARKPRIKPDYPLPKMAA